MALKIKFTEADSALFNWLTKQLDIPPFTEGEKLLVRTCSFKWDVPADPALFQCLSQDRVKRIVDVLHSKAYLNARFINNEALRPSVELAARTCDVRIKKALLDSVLGRCAASATAKKFPHIHEGLLMTIGGHYISMHAVGLRGTQVVNGILKKQQRQQQMTAKLDKHSTLSRTASAARRNIRSDALRP